MSIFRDLFTRDLFSSSKMKSTEKTESSIPKNEIDFSKIYPRIKALINDETNDTVELSFKDSPLFKPFAEELAIFYMIDQGDKFEFIQNKHLSDTVTIEIIHNTSLSNFARAVSDRTEVSGNPDEIMVVTNGGNFEATMLLADFLWDQLESLFNDQICVTIPANDLLFISSVNNIHGREKLKRTVKIYFDEQETHGLVSRNIYARDKQGWKLIERVN